MTRQLFDLHPLKTVLALTVLAVAAGQAEAARTRSAAQDLGVQLPATKEVKSTEADVSPNGVDAEQALQIELGGAKAATGPGLATPDAELNPLPTDQTFESAGAAVELRGKLLLQAMADLPQVGASANKSSLSLDFWDDASSARSAIDDRASAANEGAQGNPRAGGAHSNVMIPLPMAAWSGLSVLGGCGFVAGLRKLARRFL
jgi:hypothetical protein